MCHYQQHQLDFESASFCVNAFGYNNGGWRIANHPRLLADLNGDGLAFFVDFGNKGVYVSLSTTSARL